MQAVTEQTSNAGNLIGVEPMPLVTYSLSIDPGQGTLPAGTFINNSGIKAITAADALGVLAHDLSTHATDPSGAAIYTSGSFLESPINSANPGGYARRRSDRDSAW